MVEEILQENENRLRSTLERMAFGAGLGLFMAYMAVPDTISDPNLFGFVETTFNNAKYTVPAGAGGMLVFSGMLELGRGYKKLKNFAYEAYDAVMNLEE